MEYQSHPRDNQGPNSPIANPASFNGRSRNHRTAGAGRRAPSRDTRSGGHERRHLLPPKTAIREPQSAQPLQRMSTQIIRTPLPTSCTQNLDLPKKDQTRDDYSDSLSTELKIIGSCLRLHEGSNVYLEVYGSVWFKYESITDSASELMGACASGTSGDIVRRWWCCVQCRGTRGERTYSSQKAGLPLSRVALLIT